MDQKIQKVTTRLIISTIVFLILEMLSGIAFYYLHAKAPIVPLLVFRKRYIRSINLSTRLLWALLILLMPIVAVLAFLLLADKEETG